MTKLAQTLGLTEFQTEIVATVRQFVEKEIIPNAPELERGDTYPQAHRRRTAGHGPVRPDDSAGVRRAGGVAVDLRAVRRGAGAGLDERVGRAQHPLHRGLHAAPARHRRAEAAIPAADGDRRDARRVLDVRAGTGLRRRRDPHPGDTQSGRHLHHRRPEDVAHQRRQFDAGGRAGAHRRRRGQAAPQPHRVPGREADRFRRSRARPGRFPARSTSWATRASTPPNSSSTATRPAPTTSSAASPGRASSR